LSDEAEFASGQRRSQAGLGKARPFFIAAAAWHLLLWPLGWSAYYTRAAQVAQQTAQAMRQKNDSMHGAEAQLDKLKKQITALDNIATPLITAVSDRNFWPQIIEDLNTRLPEADIWITELAATSGGKLLGAPEKARRETARHHRPTVAGSPAKGGRAAAGYRWHLVRGLYLYIPSSRKSSSITCATLRSRRFSSSTQNAGAHHRNPTPSRTTWNGRCV
jgi:hypothetical protein